MKPLNVFIFPTDDRSGQALFIYHYARLGHKVFLPKFGTLGLNWSRIATWPMLLCKSSEDVTQRNIDIHGFVRDDVGFGEDFFLENHSLGPIYTQDISCSIVDVESQHIDIDVFHTLRGGEQHLPKYFEITKAQFPNAKWVSSTFNQHTSAPGNFYPKNAAKLIPAPYEDHHFNVNNVCLMATDFEAQLLGANITGCLERKGFASFNHNFANRQPVDYKLFEQVNKILTKDGYDVIPNFGGNIRTQGADIRYSGDNGVTGNFTTVSPKEAYEMTSKLTAVFHAKSDDWGGGVWFFSLNSGTPIITTNRYVKASNSSKYLIHDQNAVLVDTPEQATNAIKKLTDEKPYALQLQNGMHEMKKSVFDQSYWTRWESFLEKLQ